MGKSSSSKIYAAFSTLILYVSLSGMPFPRLISPRIFLYCTGLFYSLCAVFHLIVEEGRKKRAAVQCIIPCDEDEAQRTIMSFKMSCIFMKKEKRRKPPLHIHTYTGFASLCSPLSLLLIPPLSLFSFFRSWFEAPPRALNTQ